MWLLKRKISIHQNTAILLCAAYVGIVMNMPIYIRRYMTIGSKTGYIFNATNILLELLVIFVTITSVMLIVSFFGRMAFKIFSSLIIIFSAVASFYMIFYNVVIGYGIIISILTTDVDLSKEVISKYSVCWTLFTGVVPVIIMNSYCYINSSTYHSVKNKGGIIRLVMLFVICLIMLFSLLYYFRQQRDASRKEKLAEMPNPIGVIYHSYVPSNWLVGLVIHAFNIYEQKMRTNTMFDPANHYTYELLRSNNDILLVFVIGESARYDHMSLFGYERDTNVHLRKEENLIAIKGISSDTSTKLSLRTMFVRDGGYDQRTMMPKEENIFSVLKTLGFTSELFAMQSEVWFYNSLKSDFYKIREVIASEKDNAGKPIDDMLLIPELEKSINRHPNGKHLIILHTKGQHYLYTKRYPRNFAVFTPECMSTDAYCDKQKQINSYDNSMLYTDYFLSNVISKLKNKKAMLFYTSDHGESIGENSHFHGTPKEIAPPEQRMVPFIIWASPAYLGVPENLQSFERLKSRQGEVHRHEEIFDTLLGCLGYTSPDNGINQANNWCR